RRHVDHHPTAHRASGEAMASTARRTLQSLPTYEQDCLRDVLRRRALHDGPRLDVMEPGVERLGQLLVGGRAGQDHIPGDHAPKCLPIESRHCHGTDYLHARYRSCTTHLLRRCRDSEHLGLDKHTQCTSRTTAAGRTYDVVASTAMRLFAEASATLDRIKAGRQL